MTWLGTLNLQRTGVSKNNAVAALLREFECSILGLQELDLNAASNVSYVDDWQKLGITCLLGSFDEMKSMYRVALLSRLPILQIQCDGVFSPSRFCAGVIDFHLGNGVCDKLVVCTFMVPPEMKQALGNWSLRSPKLYPCFAISGRFWVVSSWSKMSCHLGPSSLRAPSTPWMSPSALTSPSLVVGVLTMGFAAPLYILYCY